MMRSFTASVLGRVALMVDRHRTDALRDTPSDFHLIQMPSFQRKLGAR